MNAAAYKAYRDFVKVRARQAGFETLTALAAYLDVAPGSLNHTLADGADNYNKQDNAWRQSALNVAHALMMDPERLFGTPPATPREKRVKQAERAELEALLQQENDAWGIEIEDESDDCAEENDYRRAGSNAQRPAPRAAYMIVGSFAQAQSPEDACSDSIMKRNLANAMRAHLSPREERVLRMRFGIGVTHEHSLLETAEAFGPYITAMRVRQIEMKALRKLKDAAKGGSRHIRRYSARISESNPERRLVL